MSRRKDLFLQNLAGLYLTEIGDLTRAIPLFEQTLTDRIRVLGTDHPDTLRSRNNLASTYWSAGDLTPPSPYWNRLSPTGSASWARSISSP